MSRKKVIVLSGPEGNAWSLLGYGKQICEATDKDWKAIKADMMSSDYDHLVAVFKKNFGDYFTLTK